MLPNDAALEPLTGPIVFTPLEVGTALSVEEIAGLVPEMLTPEDAGATLLLNPMASGPALEALGEIVELNDEGIVEPGRELVVGSFVTRGLVLFLAFGLCETRGWFPDMVLVIRALEVIGLRGSDEGVLPGRLETDKSVEDCMLDEAHANEELVKMPVLVDCFDGADELMFELVENRLDDSVSNVAEEPELCATGTTPAFELAEAVTGPAKDPFSVVDMELMTEIVALELKVDALLAICDPY